MTSAGDLFAVVAAVPVSSIVYTHTRSASISVQFGVVAMRGTKPECKQRETTTDQFVSFDSTLHWFGGTNVDPSRRREHAREFKHAVEEESKAGEHTHTIR